MTREIHCLAAVMVLIFGGAIALVEGGPSYSAESAQIMVVTPSGRIASQAELEAAHQEWSRSGHAETYDAGMGANTTCVKCKSPMNWDPTKLVTAQEALDCGACKRIPGQTRPELETGVPISLEEWIGIPCRICHIPAGDSYYVEIAFWNQASGSYELISSPLELCAKCHEGQHGFEVVEEQTASIAHAGWSCTACHGPHGSTTACTDCHDPTVGVGAAEHARHPNVNCTACHDQGGLSVAFDGQAGSRHFGEYVTRRFAHTLTSWPSHDLGTDILCQRCHHPQGTQSAVVADEVACWACHADGAMWSWCKDFNRDPAPP